ncbi:MAG: hypothetical protein ACI9HB_002935 [Gammaproteobacteria bacterium]|jgi:hypothetical protein
MFSRLTFFAAILLSMSSPVLAQDFAGDALSPQQFYNLGQALMRDGEPQGAANVADALLQRKSDDPAALILRAEAAIALGDFSGAARFARTAYYTQTSGVQKFAAARLVALAQSQLAQDSRAQLWLRRARQYAPNAQTAKSVADDYRFLRDRNPWSSSLRFGVTPSSNVNGGSSKDSGIMLLGPFGLGLSVFSEDAKALSGLAVSAGGNTSYRLAASNTAATFLTASADIRTYALSQSAKEQAPNVSGRDYSDATLAFGVRHRQILRAGAQPTDFSLKTGRTWYGGDPYTHFAEGSVAQSFTIDSDNRLSASLSARRSVSLTDDEPVSTVSLNTRWQRNLQNNDRLSFGIDFKRAKSDTPDSDYTAISYSANYDFADSFAGMRFGFGLNAETRDYGATRYHIIPREDQSIALSMSVEFTNLEFYGFRPVMNARIKRDQSNVDRFDRDYGSLGFDLRSSF